MKIDTSAFLRRSSRLCVLLWLLLVIPSSLEGQTAANFKLTVEDLQDGTAWLGEEAWRYRMGDD